MSDLSDGGQGCGDDDDEVWKLMKPVFQRVEIWQPFLVAY